MMAKPHPRPKASWHRGLKPRLPDHMVSRDATLLRNQDYPALSCFHYSGRSWRCYLPVAGNLWVSTRPSMHNFLTPLAETRLDGVKGYGSFARQAMTRGTIVATFGGIAANRKDLANFPEERQRRSIQIDIDLFLIGPVQREPGDSINHSCDPNCGMRNATQVVAMRTIAEGEELTFDYAMTDTSDYDEFECSCSTTQCRGVVRANDWRLDELRQRYAGFFSPYIRRLIHSSQRSRLLTKREVEHLLLDIDDSAWKAILHALRVVVGQPDATWETAIAMYCGSDTRQLKLLDFDTAALDEIARELNETRGALYSNPEGR